MEKQTETQNDPFGADTTTEMQKYYDMTLEELRASSAPTSMLMERMEAERETDPVSQARHDAAIARYQVKMKAYLKELDEYVEAHDLKVGDEISLQVVGGSILTGAYSTATEIRGVIKLDKDGHLFASYSRKQIKGNFKSLLNGWTKAR